MRQILIGKDIAYAAKVGGGVIADLNEIDQLDDGALAVFTEDGTLLIGLAAAVDALLVDVKKVYYVLGGKDTTEGAIISQMIPRASARLDAAAYLAPVKEVVTVGNDLSTGALNFPGTLIAGTIASMRIIEKDPKIELGLEKFRYEHYVTAGDTNQTIIDGLVAKINGNSKSPMIAAKVGAGVGITLTAKEFGKTFEVTTDDIMIDATKQYNGTGNSVAIEFGSGTADQVAAIEEEFSAGEGNTSKLYLAGKYFSKAPKTASGGTYDLWNMAWTNVKGDPIVDKASVNKTLVIASPDGTAGQAALIVVQTSVFGTAGGSEESGADA